MTKVVRQRSQTFLWMATELMLVDVQRNHSNGFADDRTGRTTLYVNPGKAYYHMSKEVLRASPVERDTADLRVVEMDHVFGNVQFADYC